MNFTSTIYADGPERVTGVFFRIAEAWTKNPVDYWRLTTWLRRGTELPGRVLGTVDMAVKSIAAETDIDVWVPTNEVPFFDMDEGDSLVTIVERNGAPPQLEYPRIIRDWTTR